MAEKLLSVIWLPDANIEISKVGITSSGPETTESTQFSLGLGSSGTVGLYRSNLVAEDSNPCHRGRGRKVFG